MDYVFFDLEYKSNPMIIKEAFCEKEKNKFNAGNGFIAVRRSGFNVCSSRLCRLR